MTPKSESLLDIIAAELSVGDHLASAVLISPTLALTAAHVLGETREVQLASHSWESRQVSAKVEALDTGKDIALLRLSTPAVELPIEILNPAATPQDLPWIIISATPEGPYRYESRDVYPYAEVGYLLVPANGYFAPSLSGSPVFAGGKLVGIVVRQQEGSLVVVSALSMAASPKFSAVADHFTLDDASFFQLRSPSTGRALSVAVTLRGAASHHSIHMEHLILGLYAKEQGPAQRLIDKDAGGYEGLRQALRESVEADMPNLPTSAPPEVPALPESSRHVREAYVHARNIARAKGSPKIQSRHLFYGALCVEQCSVIKALVKHGVVKERIVLTDQKAVARALAVAGYRSDAVGGADLLDIRKEVEALCMVLSAKDVAPPISLGLFGDWGSGKSFFMEQMEKWFNALMEMSEEERAASPYCTHIVQLKFNAWHYSDTNLWATLASAILQGLAQALVGKDNFRDHYERASLEKQKSEAEKNLAELERKAGEADSAVRSAAQRVESLNKPPTPAQLANASVRAAAEDPALRQDLKDAGEKLGIKEVEQNVDTLYHQLEDVKGLWDTVLATLRCTSGTRNFVYAGIAIVIVVAAILVANGFASHPVWLKFVESTGVLAGLAASAQRFLAPVARAVNSIRRVQASAQAKIREASKAKLEAAEKELASLQAGARAALASANAQRESIDGLELKLGNLRPDRQMLEFIEQRSQSPDYLTKLGTISHARRDFEQLTALLDRVRELAEHPQAGSAPPLLKRIDRIVLYIDDLDRCPESKVVQVLQAVHLLLAFKLFVVVVGVDPRWLLHSLRQHSSAFQDAEGGDGLSDTERAKWRATPLNYLEKIFQIPFTLRPMETLGFDRMIDALAAVVKLPEPESVQPKIGVVEEGNKQGGGEEPEALKQGKQTKSGEKEEPEKAGGVGVRSLPLKIEIPMKPASLEIQSWETTCMKRLSELIPSPRATKRFVNVYRLLRISVEDNEWEAFLDFHTGYHRPALTLLAMLMGYPEETTQVLRVLIEGSRPEEAVDGNTTQQAVDPMVWDVIQQMTPERDASRPPTPAEERWFELSDKLGRVEDLIPPDLKCSQFRSYAVAVARYSFQSGRALLAAGSKRHTQMSPPPAGLAGAHHA